MYDNLLLLQPESTLDLLVSDGALLQIITQTPLPEESEIPAEPVSPTTAEPSVVEPDTSLSSAPRLTNPKYQITPAMTKLNAMSNEELSHVEGVSVEVAEIGKIEWEEAVDLRNLDLDELVSFEVEDGYPSVSVGVVKGDDE